MSSPCAASSSSPARRARGARSGSNGVEQATTTAQSASAAGSDGHVDGVLAQRLERHDLQRALVRRGEHDVRRGAVLVGAQPVDRRDAPAVAGHEAREAVQRHRRREVVADAALVVEELLGHDRADRVAAEILGSGAAAAVAVEAGQRIGAAGLQRPPRTLRSAIAAT